MRSRRLDRWLVRWGERRGRWHTKLVRRKKEFLWPSFFDATEIRARGWLSGNGCSKTARAGGRGRLADRPKLGPREMYITDWCGGASCETRRISDYVTRSTWATFSLALHGRAQQQAGAPTRKKRKQRRRQIQEPHALIRRMGRPAVRLSGPSERVA